MAPLLIPKKMDAGVLSSSTLSLSTCAPSCPGSSRATATAPALASESTPPVTAALTHSIQSATPTRAPTAATSSITSAAAKGSSPFLGLGLRSSASFTFSVYKLPPTFNTKVPVLASSIVPFLSSSLCPLLQPSSPLTHDSTQGQEHSAAATHNTNQNFDHISISTMTSKGVKAEAEEKKSSMPKDTSLEEKSTTTATTTSSSPSPKTEPARGPAMNPVYKYSRALFWATYFNLGTFLIVVTQFLGLPLKVMGGQARLRAHFRHSAAMFGRLLVSMNEMFAPTEFVLTGDRSAKEIVTRNLKEAGYAVKNKAEDEGGNERVKSSDSSSSLASLDANGDRKSNHGDAQSREVLLQLPERLVMISNHQIYSDWLYLWCLTYMANRHDGLKIALRGDLASIPFVGWGMKNLDFIFLKRNDWLQDKKTIEDNLDRLGTKDPLCLILFPEGTVVSEGTRARSAAFGEKSGLKPHKHLLLPRTSGLFVCLSKLRGSVDYIYDMTVGYSGVTSSQIPEKVYPLPGLYINKAQPKQVHVHVSRISMSEVPETEPEFVEWLRKVWIEKDERMEEFYTKGHFPSDLEDVGGVEKSVAYKIPLQTRRHDGAPESVYSLKRWAVPIAVVAATAKYFL